MLSICIPVYNSDVHPLVNELLFQGDELSIPYEIIVLDDGSAPSWRMINKELGQKIKLIELPENIGRSRIRNEFLNHAKHEYLLFLDGDVVIKPSFLKNYEEILLTQKPEVVIGGKEVGPKPQKKHHLRWKYTLEREALSVEERSENPYRAFITGNFIVKKSVLDQYRFEESLSGWGHEDTLFGFQLKKANIPIVHIDNPILVVDFDELRVFIKKNQQGIHNLLKVLDIIDYDPDFIQDVKLLRVYQDISSNSRFGCFNSLAKPLSLLVKELILLGFVNLSLLDAYKLLYLIYYNKQCMLFKA